MHIGDLLVEHKLISEGQLDVPYVDLKQYRYQQEVVHLLPETLARRYRAIVLADRKNLNDL